ncbi:uncharacterized protein [Nicotiana tomentosiformis]|uniref:uncharacterized protein n=1 Tax=Nicotiana tomentosiformis TaxID=4098 RepID=UPI00388CB18D
MEDEITNRFHKFILSEEETNAVALDFPDIQSSMKDCEVSLLGKVISDKKANFQGVKNSMLLAWGNPAGWKVWKKSILVWNIPLHWMSKDVGRKIGHALGGAVDIVIPETGSREGRHMRLKVMMNINKPLLREKLINLGFETKWIELRYENLPYVCYYCGMLGHNDKNCVQKEKDIRAGTIKGDQFGPWLRAENHALFSENLRRQGGTTNNEGNTMVRNRNPTQIVGRNGEGTSKSLIHLDEGADSTDTQPARKANVIEVEQNGLKGKTIMSSIGKADDEATTDLANVIKEKKQKQMVEREASPKWPPSSQ